MRELSSNDWWKVLYDEARYLVVLRRTALPLPLDGADLNLASFDKIVTTLPTERCGLLIDLRDGPMRNDSAFESAAKQRMHDGQRLSGRFARSATLVRTAVGKLQTTRLQREEGAVQRKIFLDELEAIAYLTGK